MCVFVPIILMMKPAIDGPDGPLKYDLISSRHEITDNCFFSSSIFLIECCLFECWCCSSVIEEAAWRKHIVCSQCLWCLWQSKP